MQNALINQESKEKIIKQAKRVFKTIWPLAILLIAFLVLFRYNQPHSDQVTENAIVATPSEEIDPTQTERLQAAKNILSWITSQKDERNTYLALSQCTPNEANSIVCTPDLESVSNRLGSPVMWARYQYWLATKDSVELTLLEQDINSYYALVENNDWSIQTNFLNCYYLLPIVKSQETGISNSMKEKARFICNKSYDEAGFSVNEEGREIDISQPDLATATSQINQKILYILGQSSNYQPETDNFIQLIPFAESNETYLIDWSTYTTEFIASRQINQENYPLETIYYFYNGALSYFIYQNQHNLQLVDLSQITAATASFISLSPNNINLINQFLTQLKAQLSAQTLVALNTLIVNNDYFTLTTLAQNQAIINQTSSTEATFLDALWQVYQNNYRSIYQTSTQEVLIDGLSDFKAILPNAIFSGLLSLSVN